LALQCPRRASPQKEKGFWERVVRLAKVADVILHDQRSILTVSSPSEEVEGVKDVSVSLPRLVGGQGIISTFPLPLSEEERATLNKSAETVKKAIEEVEKSR
jgi:L-lactate dehydrogenase